MNRWGGGGKTKKGGLQKQGGGKKEERKRDEGDFTKFLKGLIRQQLSTIWRKCASD